jgi:hypothetical protein
VQRQSPCGSRPSTAALTRYGARKASEDRHRRQGAATLQHQRDAVAPVERHIRRTGRCGPSIRSKLDLCGGTPMKAVDKNS